MGNKVVKQKSNKIAQITERIIEVMNDFGDDTAKFSRRLDMEYGAVQPVVGPRGSKPSAEMLQAIAQHTEVDSQWLLTGVGEAKRIKFTDEDLLSVVVAHGRAVNKYLDDIHRLETVNTELDDRLKKLDQDEKATEKSG